jgi:5-methylcytosine-specific restriction endonuclease McrBC GTP-binding regulatory subunit McrB
MGKFRSKKISQYVDILELITFLFKILKYVQCFILKIIFNNYGAQKLRRKKVLHRHDFKRTRRNRYLVRLKS